MAEACVILIGIGVMLLSMSVGGLYILMGITLLALSMIAREMIRAREVAPSVRERARAA